MGKLIDQAKMKVVQKSGEKFVKKLGYNPKDPNDIRSLTFKSIHDLMQYSVQGRLCTKKQLFDFLNEEMKQIDKDF